MADFFLLWLGQMISMVGSALPAFAFEIDVFQSTHSVTSYALIYIFLLVPGILFSPVAGVIVDFFSKKNTLIVINLCMALNTLVIYILHHLAMLNPISIYLFSTINSFFNMVQSVALLAVVGGMVKSNALIKGNYLIILLNTVPRLFGPAIAGYFLVKLGMANLLLVDIFSFLIVILSIVFTSFPSLESAKIGDLPLIKNLLYGWDFIKGKKLFFQLIGFSTASRIAVSIQGIYAFLIILLLSNAIQLGFAFALVGAFQIAGVLSIGLWQKTKIHALTLLSLLGFLESIVLLVGYLVPNIWWIAIAYGSFLYIDTLSRSCNRSIWQNHIPREALGRVFGFSNSCAQISAVLAFLVAGPVADHILGRLLSFFKFATTSHASLTQLKAQGLMLGLTLFGFLFLGFIVYLSFFLINLRQDYESNLC